MEKFEIITVTPEMAQEWLKHNPNNRNIRYATVKSYALQMIAGDWDITGQAISFDTEGKLIDGQHRLSAVILAKKPVKMLVATGLRRTFNYDNGRQRQATDAIYMATGKRFTRSAISAASLAIRITEQRAKKDRISVDEQYRWLMKHEDSIKKLGITSTNNKMVATAPIILAMITAYESGISAEQIIGWREVIGTGIYDLPYQETAVRFKNWWYQKYSDRNTAKGHHNEILKAAQFNIQNYAYKKTVKNIKVPETFIFKIK